MILVILEELEVAWRVNSNDDTRNKLEEFACALDCLRSGFEGGRDYIGFAKGDVGHLA
jgi:hypothetical protein